MYIREYPGTLNADKCEELVNFIKSKDDYFDVVHWQDKPSTPFLTDLNSFLYDKTIESVDDYLKLSGGLVTRHTLELSGFGLIRQPVGYHDNLHHDIETVINPDNVRIRAFVSLIYLNDDFEGGNLVFPTQKKVIDPEVGKFVIFPASYLFPHHVLPICTKERFFIRLAYNMKSSFKDEDLDISQNV